MYLLPSPRAVGWTLLNKTAKYSSECILAIKATLESSKIFRPKAYITSHQYFSQISLHPSKNFPPTCPEVRGESKQNHKCTFKNKPNIILQDANHGIPGYQRSTDQISLLHLPGKALQPLTFAELIPAPFQQLLPRQAGPSLHCGKGLAPFLVQDFAFVLVEFHEVPVGSFLQPL